MSAQTLAFVGRRLLAERVGLVFGLRESDDVDELEGLPELVVEGLAAEHARVLLDTAFPGPLDERVQDRILGEAGGNPLALIELPRGLTPAELAGGFGLADARPLASRIEHTFLQRVQTLPRDTQLLLLTAAAEPLGDSGLLWQAAERLGIVLEAGAAGRGRRIDRVRGARALPASTCPLSDLWRVGPGRPPRCGTGRSLTRPIRSRFPTAAPGIARMRRRRRTSQWPVRWRTRPIVPSVVAAWRRPPRFSSVRPS